MEIQDVFDYLKNELHLIKEIRVKRDDFKDYPIEKRREYIGIYLTDPTNKELVLIGEVEI